jgi:8-oxo-dGTP pyrophosphatase MutT (NUDIX family)
VTRQEKLNELREKHMAPVEAAARRMFSSPDGKKVLAALERAFGAGVAIFPAGGVDPHGTLVRAGHAEVINYLRTLAEDGQGGQG